MVIPSSPFAGSILLSGQGDYNAIGSTTGTLGVTNLTLTNLSPSAYTVDVSFAVLLPGGLCRKQDIIGAGLSDLYIRVPFNQTVSISYPTPLTGHAPSTPGCIAASVITGAGEVQVSVTGFTN